MSDVEELVSVIIPTYNRAEMLCECVRKVLSSDYPNFEVCVVDDASPDETLSLLKKNFGGDSRVRVFRNACNASAAYTRNHGAREARGNLFLFLDDDNLVEPTMISALVRCHRRFPESGLIAPLSIHRIEGDVDRIWTLGADFSVITSRPKDYLPLIPFEGFQFDREVYPTTYSPNAFMIPRDVFEAVEGFDASLGIMFDESDLGWRIREKLPERRDFYICPAAKTFHLGYVSPNSSSILRHLGIGNPRRCFLFARNRPIFAKRHFPWYGALSVMFIFAPLSALYYCTVAIRQKRPDIAWAYIKGTFVGMFKN